MSNPPPFFLNSWDKTTDEAKANPRPSPASTPLGEPRWSLSFVSSRREAAGGRGAGGGGRWSADAGAGGGRGGKRRRRVPQTGRGAPPQASAVSQGAHPGTWVWSNARSNPREGPRAPRGTIPSQALPKPSLLPRTEVLLPAEVLPPPPPRARGQGGPHLLDGAILRHSELLLLLRGLHGDFHDLGLRRGSGRGGAGTFGRGGAVLGARRAAAFTTLGHGGGGGDSGAQEGAGERGGASRRQSRPARAAENARHAASATTGARPPWQARSGGARCGLRRRPGSGARQPPCVQTPLGRSDIRSRRRSSSSPPLPPRPSAGAAQGTPGNSAGGVAESCPAGPAATSRRFSFLLPLHCSEGGRSRSGGLKAKWGGRDQFSSFHPLREKNKLGGSGRCCDGALWWPHD